jgi:hypothetical protein
MTSKAVKESTGTPVFTSNTAPVSGDPEFKGTPGLSSNVASLVHQIAWPPASFAEKPLLITKVILLSRDETTMGKYAESCKLPNLSLGIF